MVIITCYKGEELSYSCCGGGTGWTEIFRGLIIDDNGTQTKIYWPFEIYLDNSLQKVLVSDYKGGFKSIALSETSFASFEELKTSITDCAFCCTDSSDDEPGCLTALVTNSGVALVDNSGVAVVSDSCGSVALVDNSGVALTDDSGAALVS